jgi:regulator of protease activity HflC (stomatin/prohibitin superfamily)
MELIFLGSGFLIVHVILIIFKLLSLYTIVNECEAHVFTLFGKVIGKIDESGLHFPIFIFGPKALIIPIFGDKYVVNTALKQHYLRSQMVNSEEGTPMGVGIWYEMQVTDPVAYLFNNADPEGSLEANVVSATISTLSNLEMEKMLEDRHSLSRTVREAVSPLSEKWGYSLGSVYIRKVAFTDQQMVKNITEKVVRRLVQVTSAMKQDGDNRVGLIKSETARKVSQQMAEATTTHPAVVGKILHEIYEGDPEILDSVLTVRETEQLISSKTKVELLPEGVNVMLNISSNS